MERVRRPHLRVARPARKRRGRPPLPGIRPSVLGTDSTQIFAIFPGKIRENSGSGSIEESVCVALAAQAVSVVLSRAGERKMKLESYQPLGRAPPAQFISAHEYVPALPHACIHERCAAAAFLTVSPGGAKSRVAARSLPKSHLPMRPSPPATFLLPPRVTLAGRSIFLIAGD